MMCSNVEIFILHEVQLICFLGGGFFGVFMFKNQISCTFHLALPPSSPSVFLFWRQRWLANQLFEALLPFTGAEVRKIHFKNLQIYWSQMTWSQVLGAKCKHVGTVWSPAYSLVVTKSSRPKIIPLCKG